MWFQEERQLKVVDGKRAGEELRGCLEEVDAPFVCGIGVVNRVSQLTLHDPEVFVCEGGSSIFVPPPEVQNGLAALCVFASESEGGESSGCLCYAIGDTKHMLAVLWVAGPQGSRFNAACLHRGSCDRELYDELCDNSLKCGRTLMREERGYRVEAQMLGVEESRCALLVECSPLIAVMGSSPVPAGSGLSEECQKLVKAFKGTNCCAVGVGNGMKKGNHLGNCQTLMEAGRMLVAPAEVVEPGLGSAAMFCKREFAPKGTCGCLSYDIGDTNMMVVLKWRVPPKEKTLSGQQQQQQAAEGENMFNAAIMGRKELDQEICDELETGMQSYRQGKLERETQDKQQGGFKAYATMTGEEKAVVLLHIENII